MEFKHIHQRYTTKLNSDKYNLRYFSCHYIRFIRLDYYTNIDPSKVFCKPTKGRDP